MAGKGNNIYISDRLKSRLSQFKDIKYTIIQAPAGYGKTHAVRNYMRTTGYNIRWLNCNVSGELFWNEFCRVLSESTGQDTNALLRLGFPGDTGSSSAAAEIVRNMRFAGSDVFVFDNYDAIENEYLNHIFRCLREEEEFSFKALFIMERRLSPYMKKLVIRHWVNYVNDDDLSLLPDDIREYFKINGIAITGEQAQELYDMSCGWPIIISFQLEQYQKNKSFDASDRINIFISSEIFSSISEEEWVFLTKMSAFGAFTAVQAVRWSNMPVEHVKKYIENNVFIRYNSTDRVYNMNPLIRNYLEKDLYELPLSERNGMFTLMGDLYSESGDFFQALKCYYRAGNFQRMFEIKVNASQIFSYVIKENRKIFLDAARHYFGLENKGDYQFAITLVVIMFLYNENTLSADLSGAIKKDVENDKTINQDDKSKIFADLLYADSFMHFNDYGRIRVEIDNIKKNDIMIRDSPYNNIPFGYGSPSILLLYHSNAGRLDQEVSFMEETASTYYRFTDGHGKGFETIAKAEMQYMRGDIKSAEILCLKGMYIADSRKQLSILLAANLILARIAVFTGDMVSLVSRMELFSRRTADVEDGLNMYARMADISRGFIYSSIGEKDRIPSWLKDEKKIEDNSNFITLACANIVYGRYLLLDRQYYRLQAVSGQFIGIAETYSYVLPKVYTYIYIAISNNETGTTQKAKTLLTEAIELSREDRAYMPFVENYEQLEPIVSGMKFNNEQLCFMKEVKKIYREYEKGIKAISKNCREKYDFGLTAREIDVAKLAARRMSNKEIAEVLFIAESTVKSNLKSIYAKLGINSRTELNNYFE